MLYRINLMKPEELWEEAYGRRLDYSKRDPIYFMFGKIRRSHIKMAVFIDFDAGVYHQKYC